MAQCKSRTKMQLAWDTYIIYSLRIVLICSKHRKSDRHGAFTTSLFVHMFFLTLSIAFICWLSYCHYCIIIFRRDNSLPPSKLYIQYITLKHIPLISPHLVAAVYPMQGGKNPPTDAQAKEYLRLQAANDAALTEEYKALEVPKAPSGTVPVRW